jgi:NAD(P)-dependent dehydrogenase (short-subunit alcohol dehydrogenase family)
MSLPLSNQTAVVSGSTAGIGFAIAEALARDGADVVVNGRSQARVDAAIAAIGERVPGASLRGVAADLSGADGAAAFVAAVPRADILVNNVGIFEPRPFAEIADDEWQRMFDANVMSGVRLARHYLPGMLERGQGRVIFISSESGLQIPTEMIHYGMSKAAQIAIAGGMARLTRGTAVTVNSVLAGPTRSEGVGTFVERLATDAGVSAQAFEKQFFDSARPTSLLQRFIEPDEIARVVAFVASPAASAVNGAALRAEGGVMLSAF